MIFGRAQGLGVIDQSLQREAGPRDGHRPGLDTTVAIEALFERHRLQEVVDGDLARRFDHAVDLDLPRPRLQRLRRVIDVLGFAEFIEIVVMLVDVFGRHRPVERVSLVAFGGIEASRRIGLVVRARQARQRRQERARGDQRAVAHEGAPVEKQGFGRRFALGDLPTFAANDVHV